MARTLLRGAGACRQRISPAQRRGAAQLSQGLRVQRKRGHSKGMWGQSGSQAATETSLATPDGGRVAIAELAEAAFYCLRL
jgi:hypothetical protein